MYLLQFYMYLNISPASIYLISASILFIILFILFVLFFLKAKEKQNEMLLKQQKERSYFQQTLLQTQLEIQEQTLKNISQEIHDNIGQVLSLAKLNLNRIDIDRPVELEQKITDSKELVSKAIHDLRDLSKSLHTDNITAIGLIKAIEAELGIIEKTGSHKTTLQIDGNVKRLDSQKELILFRIVQEVLNNIIRHAEANLVLVKVVFNEDKVELQITEDGKGFNTETTHETGLGMRNMYNRAKLINASFTVNSVVNQGTTALIRLPINQ